MHIQIMKGRILFVRIAEVTPATVLRIFAPDDRKFPFPRDCSGGGGALKVSFIIIRSDVVPELSLKFTSSAGVVAAVAINYSCFGCRARAFITICAICKPPDCFNKELVRMFGWFTTRCDCVLVRNVGVFVSSVCLQPCRFLRRLGKYSEKSLNAE